MPLPEFRLPGPIDGRLRMSDQFTRVQTEFLHRGNAAAYLSNSSITGLTSIDQASLENLVSPDYLVTGILIPAARQASTQGTTDVFAQRVCGLEERWRSHHRSRAKAGDPLQIKDILLIHDAPPEDEPHYATVLAHLLDVNDLLRDLDIYHPVGELNWKEHRLRPMRRLAEALYVKMTHPHKGLDEQKTIADAHENLNNRTLASVILRKLPIDDPDVAGIRSRIAVASVMASPANELEHIEEFPAENLIWALSDERMYSTAPWRAAGELVRRINEPDPGEDTISAIRRNIQQLPFIPETGPIWRNLTRGVINHIENKKRQLTREMVRELAGRVQPPTGAEPADMTSMVELVSGLEAVLAIPTEELQENNMEIPDPLISDGDATQLLTNLLQIYMTTPASAEAVPVRNSLANLAATLAMGYTRQMESEPVKNLVRQANEKLSHDSDTYTSDKAYVYDGWEIGQGRFLEVEALTILIWTAAGNPGMPKYNILRNLREEIKS